MNSGQPVELLRIPVIGQARQLGQHVDVRDREQVIGN